MQITVFGANGKVGSLVVEEAIKRGHSVTAFIHGKSKLSVHKNITLIKGDVYSPKSVAKAVKGSDAVISALGSWGTPKKDILTVGMQHIIPAMQEYKIKKIVSLTGHGATAPGDKINPLHSFSRLILKVLANKILVDGETHIALLHTSGLDWTVLRSSLMNNLGDPNMYVLSGRRPWPLQTINRLSVAEAMLDLLETGTYSQRSPFIARGRWRH